MKMKTYDTILPENVLNKFDSHIQLDYVRGPFKMKHINLKKTIDLTELWYLHTPVLRVK